MSSLASIIINSLIRVILPNAISQPAILNETYNKSMQVVVLLVFAGTWLASLCLILYIGVGYYLLAQGVSLCQIFVILVSAMVLLLIGLIIVLKNNINRVKEINSIAPNTENKEQKHYHIISSFIEGFRS